MKKRLLFFSGMNFLPVFLFFSLSAQENPQLLPGDLPGMVISRSGSYEGASLWGYINGGADIYLEYGFEKVWVQELQTTEGVQKIDVYRMSDPAAAFGIYSVSSFRCREKLEDMEESCVNPYQVQFRKGNCYVSVQNNEGTEPAAGMTRDLALRVAGRISDRPHPFPWLEHIAVHNGLRITYVSGRLGLENGMPSWPPPPGEEDGFGMIIIQRQENNSWIAWLKSSGHENSVMAGERYLSMIPHSQDPGQLHARDLVRVDPQTLLLIEHTGADDPVIQIFHQLKEKLSR